MCGSSHGDENGARAVRRPPIPLSGSGRVLVAVAIVMGFGVPGLAGTIFHELVELGLVLRFTQPLEEGLEAVLFFLEATQGFGLVGVESRVPGRPHRGEGVGAVLAAAAAGRTEHALAPNHVGEKGEADRPEDDETQNHCGDPGGFAPGIKPSLSADQPVGAATADIPGRKGHVGRRHIATPTQAGPVGGPGDVNAVHIRKMVAVPCPIKR